MAEEKMNDCSAIVYGLVSSAAPDRIRYVGCTERTVLDRVWEHRSRVERPTKVGRWAIECADRGETVYGVVLQQNATFADEAVHVARLRSEGADLLNETDGDKGTRGLPPSEKLRAAWHLPASEKQKATVRELHQTKRDAMLSGLRANKADPEYLRQHAEKMRAWNARLTPEQKAEKTAKMMATRAKKTPEQEAEATRKRLASSASRTPEQQAETKRKRVESRLATLAKKRSATGDIT